MKKNLVSVLMLFIVSKGFATVKPNSLFSDNMVLQRGVTVPVWGTANDGENVSIDFDGQKVSTVAKEGKWLLKLKPLKAGGPFKMTIAGENTITIQNILVGEVWVCSGQSNMEMTLSSAWPAPILNWKEEASQANYPEIRQYHVARNASDTLVFDAKSNWVLCDSSSVKNFTAVGYFFARDLYKHLKVPIGMLFTSWGGTPAENWTTRATLEANPELKTLAEGYDKAKLNYTEALAKYKNQLPELLAKWAADTTSASLAHKPIPSKPTPPRNPAGGAGGLYNGMINPLIPYAIKGVIWYQGESNSGRGKQYQTLFPAMIKDWREHWNQDNFPFLFVQVAPFKGADPQIREAQFLTLSKVSNAGMAITTDYGDSLNIHPTNKQPVGNRLFLAARALAYKEKITYSGPLYKSFEVKGNIIELSFDHVGKGLLAKDGDLFGFTIAGEDNKFVTANAVIKGNKVIVSNSTITKPVAVQFGFTNMARGNLYNKEGLPASPFRTDVK